MPRKINEVRCTSNTKTSVGLGFILSNFNLGCPIHGDGDIELVNLVLRGTTDKFKRVCADVLAHGDKHIMGWEGIHLNEVVVYFLSHLIGNLTIDNIVKSMNSTERLNYIRSVLTQASIIAGYDSGYDVENATMRAAIAYLDNENLHLVPGLVRLAEILKEVKKGPERLPRLVGGITGADPSLDLDLKAAASGIKFSVNRALEALVKNLLSGQNEALVDESKIA